MDKNFTVIKEGKIDFVTSTSGISYVYILYNAEGDVVYVGQTSAIFVRLSQHALNQKFMDIVKCEFYLVISNHALMAENYFVETLKPLYNSKKTRENYYNFPTKKSETQMSLYEYLNKNDMTVGEFAKLIGYSRETIQNYLNGKMRLGPKAAKYIDVETKGMVPMERVLSDNPIK